MLLLLLNERDNPKSGVIVSACLRLIEHRDDIFIHVFNFYQRFVKEVVERGKWSDDYEAFLVQFLNKNEVRENSAAGHSTQTPIHVPVEVRTAFLQSMKKLRDENENVQDYVIGMYLMQIEFQPDTHLDDMREYLSFLWKERSN